MHDASSPPVSLETISDFLASGILCCRHDANLTITYANRSFYRMLQYQPGEIQSLLGGGTGGVLRDTSAADWDALGDELRQGGFADHTLKLYPKDGHHIWVSARIGLMRPEEARGEEYFCMVLNDITQERRSQKLQQEQLEAIRRAESELAESEQRYRIIMEQAADPIFDYDLKTKRVYCSPSFRQRFDFEINGGNYFEKLRNTDFIYEEDRPRALANLSAALHDGRDTHIGEYRLKTKCGRYCWHRVRGTIVRSDGNGSVRLIVFFTDTDKQKRETLRLREQAERDLLTGLYNHVTTTELIDKAILESSPEQRHALFVIDIDNFKTVNDKLGHLYGDEVLEEIALKLKEQFREEDVVGRIGGDEFVVFLKNIPSQKILSLKSRILNDLFRGTQSDGKVVCPFSCSVGVALYPRDGRNYHELFHKADIAMYAAKRSGKDRFRFYSEDLETIEE